MDGTKAPQSSIGNNNGDCSDLYIGSSIYVNHHINGWIEEVQVHRHTFTCEDVATFHKQFKTNITTLIMVDDTADF